MGRLGTAIRVLTDQAFFERVQTLAAPAEAEAEEQPELAVDAVRLLALLQREGRLVDFLREEIKDFDDAQVGAAGRSIHQGCRKVLDEYFQLAPVREEPEGSAVTIEPGFDPSAIRLAGAVVGDPPFHGTLQHHGWTTLRAALPPMPPGQDPRVVAPAEVEIHGG